MMTYCLYSHLPTSTRNLEHNPQEYQFDIEILLAKRTFYTQVLYERAYNNQTEGNPNHLIVLYP